MHPVDAKVLSRFFGMPEKAVAKHLGICLTSLKKICRQNGILRWPYRKVTSLDRKRNQAKAMLCSAANLLLSASSSGDEGRSICDSLSQFATQDSRTPSFAEQLKGVDNPHSSRSNADGPSVFLDLDWNDQDVADQRFLSEIEEVCSDISLTESPQAVDSFAGFVQPEAQQLSDEQLIAMLAGCASVTVSNKLSDLPVGPSHGDPFYGVWGEATEEHVENSPSVDFSLQNQAGDTHCSVSDFHETEECPDRIGMVSWTGSDKVSTPTARGDESEVFSF